MMVKFTLKDLEMPDDEPMVIIRSSLLWMCDGDKYAAAALNMYIHWTRWLMKHKPVAQEINQMLKKKGQAPTQDTTYIIYRKQQYLIDDMLGFCSDRRLRQANDLLQSKGLLKIEDTPRYLTDHVLKYELQIGMFKKLMNEWRKHREENNEGMEDEEAEVSLEATLDGTEKNPLRNGKKSASSSLLNGKKSASERINVGPSNIDDKHIENIDDNKEVVEANIPEAETTPTTPTFQNLSLEEMKRIVAQTEALSSEKKQPEPTKQEEVPLEQWPWNAEKALKITEAIVCNTYNFHQKELQACEKILAKYEPTQKTYEDVIQKIQKWCLKKKKLLRPSELIKPNAGGTTLFEELMEEVKPRSQKNTPAKKGTQPQTTTSMSQEEASQLATVIVTQSRERNINIQASASLVGGAWMVKVIWDGYEYPSIESRSSWDTYFVEICQIAADLASEAEAKAKQLQEVK